MKCFKELRNKSNLTQQNVANKLNISQQAVAKWENGESFPRGDLLPQLAKIFDCSIDELFDKAE